MSRKDENWNNSRKYTEQNRNEYREAMREQEMDAARIEAELAERGEVVVIGLVQKYGFSEAGARATLDYIKSMRIESARFATEEMQQAAYAANDWFWN